MLKYTFKKITTQNVICNLRHVNRNIIIFVACKIPNCNRCDIVNDTAICTLCNHPFIVNPGRTSCIGVYFILLWVISNYTKIKNDVICNVEHVK